MSLQISSEKVDMTSPVLKRALTITATTVTAFGLIAAAPATASAGLAQANLLSPKLTSTNWVGYVTTKATFTSVEASWTQPTMNCASGSGDTVFWIGLDGWGSKTVEQTGTRGQCSGGRATYSAWWETYPANPIQSFRDTVKPGDAFYSKIYYKGNSVYDILLQNKTRGWTEHITPKGASGASNASAEVVAEAPSAGGREPLANFGKVTFTGSKTNGKTFGSAGAQKIDMVQNGVTDATTGPLSGGTDFTVTWQHR